MWYGFLEFVGILASIPFWFFGGVFFILGIFAKIDTFKIRIKKFNFRGLEAKLVIYFLGVFLLGIAWLLCHI